MSTGPARAILVLGMHRSGTSVTTGLLHLLGVEVSAKMMLAHADNPKGYWEHIEIVELHEELLAALGSRWDDPLPLPTEWWLRPEVAPFRKRLDAIIERDFSDAPLWTVKDPRLCRLLPLWLPLLRARQVEPLCLLTLRDVGATVRSLIARDGFSESKALILAFDLLCTAERDSRACARTFITYEALLADAPAALEKIGAELRIEWPQSVDSRRAQIADFVDAGLARQQSGASPHPWVQHLRDDPDPASALAAIGRELATAQALFDPLLAENAQDLRAQIIALSSAAEGAATVRRQLHELSLAHAELDAAHTEMRGLRDRKNEQLTARKTELAETQQEVRGLRAELHTIQRSWWWKLTHGRKQS